ncbi:UNVERIFIED_CONTAM: hypothetical protein GTU68_014070 [Idotea baltica]|nr:hypothetical protein [Idotea baltica]
MRSLLQAGVHFGHQTSRWCPAMAPYIHSSRNGIHIINLPHSVKAWEQARKAIIGVVAGGGNILIVGTKKQAQEAVVEESRRCGAFFVSRRWLGGMITNFQTIRKSIERLQKVEVILEEEETAMKERLMMAKEREKLEFSLGGIRTMLRAPQMLFVIDIKREDIAIKEAQRLDIPVVALIDTNCDPREVEFPIPSNDDGTRAIRLFCSAVADAVMEGKKQYKSRKAKEPKKDPREVKVQRANPKGTDSAALPKSTPAPKSAKAATGEKPATAKPAAADKKPAAKEAAAAAKVEKVADKKAEPAVAEKASTEKAS